MRGAALLLMCSVAHADGFYTSLATAVKERVAAERAAHAPAPVPPTPRDVKWKPARVGSLDLGAPLVAMVADDHKLYAVTTREVVAYAIAPRVKELGRVAFTGPLAIPAPRDVVGTAVVDNGVIAAVSTFERAIRVSWKGNAMVATAAPPGFALCKGEPPAQLVPGRDYFAGNIYGAKCRELVDGTGRPLVVKATLTTQARLDVSVGNQSHAYLGVGTAFEIADVDRDGRPEVIVSGAGAPGDPDAVKVMTFGDDEKKPVFRKPFTGGVAALVELDGAVIAAVRLVGATRVDLWRLD